MSNSTLKHATLCLFGMVSILLASGGLVWTCYILLQAKIAPPAIGLLVLLVAFALSLLYSRGAAAITMWFNAREKGDA